MPADYYIVVRRLASGGSVPVCAAKTRGKLLYGNGPEIQLHNFPAAVWLRQLARETMPALEGQRDFEVVSVDGRTGLPK